MVRQQFTVGFSLHALKSDSLVWLTSSQWEQPIWPTQKTFFFSLITTSVRFLFHNYRPKRTKSQLSPHHALVVLVVFNRLMSQPLINCFGGYWSCVAQCRLLASPSFLLNCERRPGLAAAKRVCVRMVVSGQIAVNTGAGQRYLWLFFFLTFLRIHCVM